MNDKSPEDVKKEIQRTVELIISFFQEKQIPFPTAMIATLSIGTSTALRLLVKKEDFVDLAVSIIDDYYSQKE